MNEGIWVGHATVKEFQPRRLADVPGIITPFAVPVHAADELEARAKIARWHAIGDELRPLMTATGHQSCFSPTDPRYGSTCAAHAEIAVKKAELERERANLLAMPSGGMIA